MEKRKTKKRKKRGGLFLFLLVFFLFAGSIAGALLYRPALKEVRGTVYAEKEAVLREFFPEEKDTCLFRLLILSVLKPEKACFPSYEVEFDGFRDYSLIVEEEKAVARIRFEDGYLVLGESGAVLCSLSEDTGTPVLISGCGVTGYRALGEPEVQDRSAYLGLLAYASGMQEAGITDGTLRIEGGSYMLFFGAVEVCLGDTEFLREKLAVVSDQKSRYAGLSGVLHLEDYNGDTSAERYYFEVRTE